MQDFQQAHWYETVAAYYVKESSVLDVGAGSGYGMRIFEAHGACKVGGIDPLPYGPGVENVPLENMLDCSFDWTVAMDVIEHVEDDVGFMRHMLRVARIGAFFSTPNWRWYKCHNPYHFREYTPEELQGFVDLFGLKHDAWEGSDTPASIKPRLMSSVETIVGANFGVMLWKAT